MARSKAASFVFDGFVKPQIFRTNWSDAARISSSVAGGSKLNRVLMFLHIGHSSIVEVLVGSSPSWLYIPRTRSRLALGAKSRRRTGTRREPQVPGGPAKRPAQAVPQVVHLPSSVRRQSLRTYQSRPISFVPQPWQ
jgi:hypothetical protein